LGEESLSESFPFNMDSGFNLSLKKGSRWKQPSSGPLFSEKFTLMEIGFVKTLYSSWPRLQGHRRSEGRRRSAPKVNF
jgi:hypothetical protein